MSLTSLMKILVFLLPLFRFLYLSKLQMLPSDIFLILAFYLSFECYIYKVKHYTRKINEKLPQKGTIGLLRLTWYSFKHDFRYWKKLKPLMVRFKITEENKYIAANQYPIVLIVNNNKYIQGRYS